jgi:type IV pilus assembly protein PilZ
MIGATCFRIPVQDNHMSAPSAKQGLLSLQIKDKKELYSAYMPYVKGGAIFVPTPKRYQLGDEVFLMVSFLEDKSRLPVVGKVVWVSPMGQMGGRRPGVGVQMSEASENEEIRTKIEATLAGMLDSETPTHTM